MVMKTSLSYRELSRLISFDDRFNYLMLAGKVGADIFGYDRFINQDFYRSPEWKRVRDQVIIRDNACDLGIPGHEIYGKVYVHHMNPITLDDLKDGSRLILNPEYLITVSSETHNAIHYGDGSYLDRFKIIERTPNDTSPWKRG